VLPHWLFVLITALIFVGGFVLIGRSRRGSLRREEERRLERLAGPKEQLFENDLMDPSNPEHVFWEMRHPEYAKDWPPRDGSSGGTAAPDA
jgi:hypothetical protein